MAETLTKDRKIVLETTGDGSPQVIRIGLGWESVRHAGLRPALQALTGVDLDASCMMFDADHHLVDTVWSRELISHCGSVRHTGDGQDLHGHVGAEHDDESIVVDLAKIPHHITTLVFTVSNFSGPDFSRVANAYARLVDQPTGAELARFDLSSTGTHNAQIMVKAQRHNTDEGWTVSAIGAIADGRTYLDLREAVLPHL